MRRRYQHDATSNKSVFGSVAAHDAVEDFTEHTEVVNGCSDLLVQVFDRRGQHTRSAIGVKSLPKGFAVEIEAMVEIRGA
ncbi:hypothetical protein C0Z18_01970 [Trinickia dabaoshanensis]|uniref:Uncharacterized protein n=1 Tax=Trinickia dabaoshanensis TaxID=564714 RepID=A0A2N7W3L5_9BURK|nr:RidA family protein [Trinickia dabaoshanensis]PMS23998.1 hypothetical protein C0Z18_01970 [Trinickia dabaoshanensis]